MKLTDMTVNAFWKGEYGVNGLVEDRDNQYKVKLLVKGSQVRDYSCSCVNGNSFKGMCEHSRLVRDAFIKRTATERHKHVTTSQAVRTMIREYTNREVERITLEGEAEQVRLVPRLLLTRDGVSLELLAGRERLYLLKDLIAFAQCVAQGSFFEYGKGLKFHHDISVFTEDSRELVLFAVGQVNIYQEYSAQFRSGPREVLKTLRSLKLSRSNLDRFFELMGGRPLDIERDGSERFRVSVISGVPELLVEIRRDGSDGIRVSIDKGWYCLNGERCLYLGNTTSLHCIDEKGSRELRVFMEQMTAAESMIPSGSQRVAGPAVSPDQHEKRSVTVQERDIPLFYERVLHKIGAYCRLEAEDGLCLEDYKPEELKVRFEFDSSGIQEISLRPVLSYGEYAFHPVEDEKVPKAICRDVPGEFRVSQVITRYFKHRRAESGDLVIRDDEEALYELMTRGIAEFEALGEVIFSEHARRMQVIAPPRMSVDVRYDGTWLNLTVDAEGIDDGEFRRVLSAYTARQPYYRTGNGGFLRLDDSSLATVADLLDVLAQTKKDLHGRTLQLPSYRAPYLDRLLKGEQGVTLYRDQLFKALVRGINSVEDSDYEVPGSLNNILREYQKVGFRWLRTMDEHHFGGILADDMGLGKTIQIISLLADEKQRGGDAPSLVICPASLVYNWENEIHTFAPELRVRSVAGTARERQDLLDSEEQPDVYITSYELLKRDLSRYQKWEFRFQVIDEAQYIKNAGTLSAKAVKSIRSKMRFALTGTPVENRLAELWSIFDYLMPGYLFSYRRFKEKFELPIAKDNDQDAVRQLQLMIAPFVLRRLKRDVLKELPDKLETVVYSRLEGEQRLLYTAHAQRLKQQLESQNADAYRTGKLQILAELTRLRQICCAPSLCYVDYKGESAKLATCMELVSRGVEGGHKILLFSQFTSMLEIIRAELTRSGIACHMLIGETSKEKRLRMVHSFHSDSVPVFLISLKAGGTGLNLTAADIVIHYDPWWNAAAQNQATDRAHRIGQDKQVSVFQLIAKDTIEENICQLQRQKQDLADQVMSGSGVSLSSLSREELIKFLE